MVGIALVSFRRIKAGYLHGGVRSLPIFDGASFVANTVEERHRESELRIADSELRKIDGRDMVNDRRFKIDTALDVICMWTSEIGARIGSSRNERPELSLVANLGDWSRIGHIFSANVRCAPTGVVELILK
jgi:hypothetical protein